VSEERLLVSHTDSTAAADLKVRLERLGFVVSGIVETRDQALERSGEFDPDLILVEHKPEDGDIEAGPVPLLLVSSAAAASAADESARQPWRWLLLPCSDRELRLTVQFALRQHQAEQSLGESRNLLEQKITELESSERRYRTLVETPTLGFVLMDRRGRFLYVSPKIEELTGYPPAAFAADWRIGWRMTHEEDHHIGERAFLAARDGTAVLDQEFRLIHKDGSLRWALASTFPVRDVDGKVTAVQVIMFDISERKQNCRRNCASRRKCLPSGS
jgi:PAS domain S-box-containing protein